MKERELQESLGVDDRTISEPIFKKVGANTRIWIDSIQDTDYWGTLENAALNHRVPLALELNLWVAAPKGATPVYRIF